MFTGKNGKKRVLQAGIKGAADLTGIFAPAGTRVEIELKNVRTVVTDEQIAFGNAIKSLGGIHVMFRCETNDMRKELDRCTQAVRDAIEAHKSEAPEVTHTVGGFSERLVGRSSFITESSSTRGANRSDR